MLVFNAILTNEKGEQENLKIPFDDVVNMKETKTETNEILQMINYDLTKRLESTQRKQILRLKENLNNLAYKEISLRQIKKLLEKHNITKK